MPTAPVQYKPVVLNLFAEGSQIQIYDFVRVALKKLTKKKIKKKSKSIHTFYFIAERSLLLKILEVLFTGVARGAYGTIPLIFRTYSRFLL